MVISPDILIVQIVTKLYREGNECLDLLAITVSFRSSRRHHLNSLIFLKLLMDHLPLSAKPKPRKSGNLGDAEPLIANE